MILISFVVASYLIFLLISYCQLFNDFTEFIFSLQISTSLSIGGCKVTSLPQVPASVSGELARLLVGDTAAVDPAHMRPPSTVSIQMVIQVLVKRERLVAYQALELFHIRMHLEVSS